MTEYIEQGNATFAVEQAGQGEAIIFLHAGVADRRMWEPQLLAFSKQFHTIAYDRRGFGETVTPNEPFSHVDDLTMLLDHFSIEKAHLVGCSQGGRIAIDFALTHKKRVRRLALIAPAISGAPVPKAIPAKIEKRLEELDAAEEADDLNWINHVEAGLWLDGPTEPSGRVQGKLRELFLDMNGIALNMPELSQEIEPENAYGRVTNLRTRTLVLWGELDFPHIKDRCRNLVQRMRRARGIIIPKTAHLLNLERPRRVNKLLREFLCG